MFSSGTMQREQPQRSWLPVSVAAAVVVLGLASLAFFGRNRTAPVSLQDSTLQPSTYAPNLEFADVHLSQATNFAGSQVTYVDGNLTNHGSQTVIGLTVAASFPNDAGEQPQVETLPVLIIRTHQPYIDTESIGAAPLAPGQTEEFRLIFDDINDLWNQQPPQLQVLGVHLAPASK